MKALGIALAGALGIVALLAALTALGVVGNLFGVAGRVTDSDRVLGTYEQFFNRCAAVQALEDQRDLLSAQLDALEDDYDGAQADWPRDARREHARLSSSLTGVRSQRARSIAAYNAAAENRTTGWLRDHRLPTRLYVEEDTRCAL